MTETNFNSPQKTSIGIISLGCAKNRVDSEEILGQLIKAGYNITSHLNTAEIIIVNTCSFISDATEESRETILKMSSYKKTGSCKLLVVTGCLSEIYNEDILDELPEVDLSVGVNSYQDIVSLIENSLKRKVRLAVNKKPPLDFCQMPDRFLTTSVHSVNIKIAEGCNNRCSYCLIPRIRGPYRSRPMENIIKEVELLASRGTREINLIAQDTTFYGREKDNEAMLPLLLLKLTRIKNLEWVRILYGHPAHLDDKTIKIISSEKKVCSYIDLPLQHINNNILKSMNRKYSKEEVIFLLKKLRKKNISVRSTFIIGYPGEEKKDFNELMHFIKNYSFEQLGAFKYSSEKFTPAYYLKNHVSAKEKERRFGQLMRLQKKISYNNNLKHTGKVTKTFIDEFIIKKDETNYYRGRTETQAPEIDGSVIISSESSLIPGQFVPVNIIGCGSYDLIGKHSFNNKNF